MSTKESLFYSLKVWLTSWVLTPLFIFIIGTCIEYFTTNNSLHELIFKRDDFFNFSSLDILAMIYFVSFLFSFPYWLLFWPCTKIISQLQVSNTIQKILISLIASILLMILFAFFNNRAIINTEGLPWFISILLGIWFYKFHPNKTAKSTEISVEEHLVDRLKG